MSEPVLRFGGASAGFRLESFLGDRPSVRPEDLVGKTLELSGDIGMIRGTVRSVEPYVDPQLGPGHWVVLA